MSENLIRYSIIDDGPLPRELCLLQGSGCAWAKCTYCDYYLDVSDNPLELNKEVLKHVTGKLGRLDVINSGSCFELDSATISLLQSIIKDKNIKELCVEAHWIYRNKLSQFSSLFNIPVHYRFGVETFNPELRSSWKKGVGKDVTPEEIASYFDGLCLLVGIKGQTIEDIYYSVDIAEKYFKYYNVNVFCPNSTNTEIDQSLIDQFKIELLPILKESKKCEVLIDNTDLGVG